MAPTAVALGLVDASRSARWRREDAVLKEQERRVRSARRRRVAWLVGAAVLLGDVGVAGGLLLHWLSY